MRFLLEVVGDANDGDYVRQLTEVQEGQIALLHKFAHVVKIENGNWPSSEYADGWVEDIYGPHFTENELDEIWGWVPYGEYGIHTLIDITVYEFIGKTELL